MDNVEAALHRPLRRLHTDVIVAVILEVLNTVTSGDSKSSSPSGLDLTPIFRFGEVRTQDGSINRSGNSSAVGDTNQQTRGTVKHKFDSEFRIREFSTLQTCLQLGLMNDSDGVTRLCVTSVWTPLTRRIRVSPISNSAQLSRRKRGTLNGSSRCQRRQERAKVPGQTATRIEADE